MYRICNCKDILHYLFSTYSSKQNTKNTPPSPKLLNLKTKYAKTKYAKQKFAPQLNTIPEAETVCYRPMALPKTIEEAIQLQNFNYAIQNNYGIGSGESMRYDLKSMRYDLKSMRYDLKMD